MSYIQKEKKYIIQTYGRQNLIFTRSKGKHVWDINGKKYLDFFCGISVCNLGHCIPGIVRAIEKQARKLIHISNHYYMPPQILFAEMLVKSSFGKGKVFFSNSGSEANECALKMARKWKKGKYEVITFKKSFHGRTMATISATGQKKVQEGFEPLVKKFKHVEFNDISSVKRAISRKTCAVMIEPVIGEGGVYPATREFLRSLRRLCDKHGLLLIFDEVQSGFGRTGKVFAYQYYGVKPDIITLAKSIASGLPLGATVVSKKHERILVAGNHGSTFGGNPVSCNAAIEVLKCISSKKLLNNVSKQGRYLGNRLNELKASYPALIKEVRGIGLMIGMELYREGFDIVKRCAGKGLIINCTSGNVLRFMPPLNIGRKDIDTAMDILEAVLSGQGKH